MLSSDWLIKSKLCSIGHSTLVPGKLGVFATVDTCDAADNDNHNILICEYKMKKKDRFIPNSKYFVNAFVTRLQFIINACTFFFRYVFDIV